MSKKKDEQKFLTVLKHCFKRKGYYFYKIPDSASEARFQVSKPFDCFLGLQGRLGAMEAKFTDSERSKSISWKDLRPNQIEGLNHIQKCGGLAYVFYEIKFGRERRFYWFEFSELKRLYDKYEKGSRRTIKLEDLPDRNYVVRTKNRFGDFEYDLAGFALDWELSS